MNNAVPLLIMLASVIQVFIKLFEFWFPQRPFIVKPSLLKLEVTGILYCGYRHMQRQIIRTLAEEMN